MCVYVSIYTSERDLLWGMGSYDYEDWDVLPFIVCKLGIQQGKW